MFIHLKLKISLQQRGEMGFTGGHISMSYQVTRDWSYYTLHKHLYFITTIPLQGASEKEAGHFLTWNNEVAGVPFTALRKYK